jgi:SAM-dependent methyltransferase
MKTRESGMPEEEMWRQYFDVEAVLRSLKLTSTCRNVVEFGCGYGTFTIPAARIVSGMVYTLDIEPKMVDLVRSKAAAEGLDKVRVYRRDFIADGTGLSDESADYVMLFNLLHAEHPERLLREAHRVLIPGGLLGIMHWNFDPATPRGPSMEIRPRPEQCLDWAIEEGFQLLPPGVIDLPPYHYGMVLARP